MRPYEKYSLIILILTALVACSDDDNDSTDISSDDLIPAEEIPVDDTVPTEDAPVDDTDPTDTAVLNGVLIDSAVMGVNYSTDTQSGVTDDSGAFDYLAGEQITFSIGTLQFPAVAAQEVISPVDLAVGSNDPTATTTNIARLLQSLDLDGDPDNGIVIPPQAAQSAAPIDFNVTEAAFGENPEVINLVANSGSTNTTLISAIEANAHLSETLNGIDVVLNLRNTVWVSGGSVTGCDGQRSIYTLTYSETGLATSRVAFEADADGVCQRVETLKAEESFEALAEQPEFLFTCGDGICDEGEREGRVSLTADDPRNDCTGVNGEPVADERLFIVGGPDTFTYNRCANTGSNIEVFLLQ